MTDTQTQETQTQETQTQETQTQETQETKAQGQFYTDEEIAVLRGNEYKAGKEKGIEMAVKDTKERLGLNFQGKTIDGLLESYKVQILSDAKIEPTQKVKELEEKLQTLQATVKEYEGKLSEKETEVDSIRINSELYKYIPKFDEGPSLEQDDVIELMRRKGYEYKYEGSKVVAYKDGSKVTDKVGNDLPVKEIVDSFLREKKLIVESVTPSGRGVGDLKPVAAPANINELTEQFKTQGKSVQGDEFRNAVQELMKVNPDFKI